MTRAVVTSKRVTTECLTVTRSAPLERSGCTRRPHGVAHPQRARPPRARTDAGLGPHCASEDTRAPARPAGDPAEEAAASLGAVEGDSPARTENHASELAQRCLHPIYEHGVAVPSPMSHQGRQGHLPLFGPRGASGPQAVGSNF